MYIIYFYSYALTNVISITTQVARFECRILRSLGVACQTMEVQGAPTSGAWPSSAGPLSLPFCSCLCPVLEGVLYLYHRHHGLQIQAPFISLNRKLPSSPLPHLPQSQATTYLSDSINSLICNTCYKWNRTICGPL